MRATSVRRLVDARHASRRAEVSNHFTTERGSRTVSALRSRESHTVCTTSSAAELSSPVSRTVRHSNGVTVSTSSSRAARSPAW